LAKVSYLFDLAGSFHDNLVINIDDGHN
jgi:hypothetical protein